MGRAGAPRYPGGAARRGAVRAGALQRGTALGRCRRTVCSERRRRRAVLLARAPSEGCRADRILRGSRGARARGGRPRVADRHVDAAGIGALRARRGAAPVRPRFGGHRGARGRLRPARRQGQPGREPPRARLNARKSLSGLPRDPGAWCLYGPPPTFAARLTTGIATATTPAKRAATLSRLILESISVTSSTRSLMRRGSEGAVTAP